MGDIERERILLLGEDSTHHGEFRIALSRCGRSACAISVGSDPHSPSIRYKASLDHPNEDALVALLEGERAFLAVADAHLGHQSSHELVPRLGEASCLPSDLEELRALLLSCADEGPGDESPSEATLIALGFDHGERRGFGLSFGDSSLVIVSAEGAKRVSRKDRTCVTPRRRASMAEGRGNPFEFEAASGSLICLFTDGVDECHYCSPETSIGLSHLVELHGRTGSDPEAFARALVEMALAGVDGNPGGQDNIALIVTAVAS